MLSHATILAFDTSLIGSSVALSCNGQVFSQKTSSAGTQAAELLPMIESVLADAGISYDQLDSLITTVGPGSFTGIRIGLATAQGLLIALTCKVATLSSMEALAWSANALGITGNVSVAINAGKGEIASQMFHVKQSGVAPLSTITLQKPISYLDTIEDNITCIGNAASLLPVEKRKTFDGRIVLPDAAHFIHAPAAFTTAHALVPHYVRPPDAKPSTSTLLASAGNAL